MHNVLLLNVSIVYSGTVTWQYGRLSVGSSASGGKARGDGAFGFRTLSIHFPLSHVLL